ncbi:MAG: hypothetical protein R2828_03265 [Saprospiraceae bacterium]
MSINKNILKIIGVVGLGLTIIPSILVFVGSLSFETNKPLMLVGMVLWFLVAPGLTREE